MDGCDENCVVEVGFACKDGTLTSPDVCIDIVGPICEISSFSYEHILMVICNEPIKTHKPIKESFGLEIIGPKGPYIMDY